MTIFDRINYWIRNSEASLVNLLSALAPWLAPLAPAFMTFRHLTGENFDFPLYIAWSIAVVVEVLGLSAISTILAFWSYNRRRVAEYRKAPVWLALLSFVFYLTVILVVNVILDAAAVPEFSLDPQVVSVVAKALLTLLSVPAAVILAVRTQHKEMLDTVERERAERRTARLAQSGIPRRSLPAPEDGTPSRRKRKFLNEYQNGKLQAYLEANNLPLTPGTIARLYGASERTAYRWLDEVRDGKGE